MVRYTMTLGMPSRSTRRRVLSTLAGAGAASVAGCFVLGGGDGHGATDVVALNTAADSQQVTITVIGTDSEEPHTTRTFTLDSGEKVDPVNDGKLPTNGSYRVDVDVEDGPRETFDWEDPQLEQAPLWVLVDGSENIRFLLQSG